MSPCALAVGCLAHLRPAACRLRCTTRSLHGSKHPTLLLAPPPLRTTGCLTPQNPKARSSAALCDAGYVMQCAPWLGMRVLKRIGPARTRQLREGGSGYDLSAMVGRR